MNWNLEQTIQSLRQALAVSPDNVPLRVHLSEVLGSAGRWQEAEAELRQALARAPEDEQLKTALARCYHQQGKHDQAMVILESLVAAGVLPPPGRVLYARLLLGEGRVPDAVAHYKLALEEDPEVEDPLLGEQLGVGRGEQGEVFEGRVREGPAWDEDQEAEPGDVERPRITFADVGGMERLKDEIRMKIILPQKHPEMFAAYGKQAGGGILMYGPPGCGKTYLARATAGEIGAGFLSVGIDEVLDMWIGASERNLHQVFQQARANRPCVLFFDEVDALGSRRSDMRTSAGRQIINQFLAEMDGVKHSNEGVLILGATNAPWHMDPAFRRPGRFDRVLFVPPPDQRARAEILRLHCRDKPQAEIDFDLLARKTEHYSGADLKAVVDAAVEAKLQQALRSGAVQPLTTRDLLAALRQCRPTTQEWFATARNYAVYANQGGMYDEVLEYLGIK